MGVVMVEVEAGEVYLLTQRAPQAAHPRAMVVVVVAGAVQAVVAAPHPAAPAVTAHPASASSSGPDPQPMMTPDVRFILGIILAMSGTHLALLINIMLRLGRLQAEYEAIDARVTKIEQRGNS